MQVDILKQAAVIIALKEKESLPTKIDIVFRLLHIPRSSYYYIAVEPVSEIATAEKVKAIFFDNKARYVARKIKQVLETEGVKVSRRRIRRIMKKLNLVSLYQEASFKPHSKGKNEVGVPNHLARQFNEHQLLETLVTDLTDVRVEKRWAYICFIIDLYNREIIGLSIGWYKTADLVKQAIQTIPFR